MAARLGGPCSIHGRSCSHCSQPSRLNVLLFYIIPKGLFPQSDTGRLNGNIQGDQSISFQLMKEKLKQFAAILQDDPAVAHVAGFTGGRQTNGGFFFVSLKPLAERKISADLVIARLRSKLAHIPGARLILQAVQDVSVGGRQSNAQYQFALLGNDQEELHTWGTRLLAALQGGGELVDVNSDQQQNGLAINLVIDRDSASRLGLTLSAIDNTLYDAFGQRQVSTIYNPLNQYHVVMEVAPQYWQSPELIEGDVRQHGAGECQRHPVHQCTCRGHQPFRRQHVSDGGGRRCRRRAQPGN